MRTTNLVPSWPVVKQQVNVTHNKSKRLGLLLELELELELIYGRTRLDGYLTNFFGMFALLYVHIVDYSTNFEVF